VLNHSWNRPSSSADDHHGGHKRVGIAQRRGLQADMGGLTDKAAASKAADKAKADEGARSRLGQTGTSLFVDTGAKNRLVPTFDEDSPNPAGESPPTSPADQKAAAQRGRGNKAAAIPTRRYQNEVDKKEEVSPRLRNPPLCRKGQVKLNFEDDAQALDAEHGQTEVDDHKEHMDPEQKHFVDLCHHFHGAINQAGVRLNEMLLKIRKHWLEDISWLEGKKNFDELAEIAFEVQTANYFIAKFNHELEPRKAPAPVRPSKIDDMSVDDILAQALYSLSKMEVLATKLGPVLEKICHDAKTLRRGPNGEPLTPTSRNALTLAKKRGFQNIDEFNKLIGHLEHVLAATQHLASPPTSGLPAVRKMATVLTAMSKFKKGLSTKKLAKADSVISGAFDTIGKSVAEKTDEQEAEGTG